MPIYEYRCAKCSKVFETLQKFSDEPLKKHPQCGGKVERLISAPGFQFKGTGWYVTDYGKGGTLPPKTDSGAESKSESKSESQADSKSESKTEAKSESKSESKTESKSESKSDSKPAKKAS